MTTTMTETKLSPKPPEDRTERLADRVLALAREVAAQGDGRTFTVDSIYDGMPGINRQRISDGLKTLKDNRRIHAIGRIKGIYEIEEAFPAPRAISITTLCDGWRLIEVGDAIALAVTPQEAAIVGGYLAGDSVRVSMSERFKAMESALAEVKYENAQLKQRMRDIGKAAAAQGDLLA
jgi:hypothetical protein